MPGSIPCVPLPIRPIAIVCMVTPEIAGQPGRLLGVSRLRDGRLVVAVGQEHENFFLGRHGQERLESHNNRVTDIGAVVARPRRSHRRDRFQQERHGRGWGDMPGRDNWRKRPGRSGRRSVRRQNRMNVFLAASSREINRVPRSVGKSTAFMLELLIERDDDRDSLSGDAGRAADSLRPGQCHGQTADRQPAQNGRQRAQPEPTDAMAARETRPSWARKFAGRARSSNQGSGSKDQKPEPAGLSKTACAAPWSEFEKVVRCTSGAALAGDEGASRRQGAVKRGLGIGVKHRQVAHFSAGGWRPLAVKVKFDAGIERQRGIPARLSARLFPQVAEQIDHRRRHQQVGRPRGNPHNARTCCSNWLVTAASIVRCPELWGRGAISLTRSLPLERQKKLDGQNADGAKRLGGSQGQTASLFRNDRADRSRHECRVQDMALVTVKGDRIADGVSVEAAGNDDRDLRGKVDPTLGDAVDPAETGPCARDLRRFVQEYLTLAVIARCSGLEN